MKCLTNNWSCPRPGRRARKAFTFIELVVAIALSVVLLRGMYTIFHSATSLSMLSEQKMVTMLDIAAVFDYIADDVGRSRPAIDDYYLSIAADRKSIIFRMLRLDGAREKYVYAKYRLDGSDLKRRVYGNDKTATATEEADGEDGTEMTVARNITKFEAYYFDDSKSKIDATGAWDLSAILTGKERTCAVKFVIEIDTPAASAADLDKQEFTLILPIMR